MNPPSSISIGGELGQEKPMEHQSISARIRSGSGFLTKSRVAIASDTGMNRSEGSDQERNVVPSSTEWHFCT
jgi:hypothetical protein